jgi:putative ABC transport system permease protein
MHNWLARFCRNPPEVFMRWLHDFQTNSTSAPSRRAWKFNIRRMTKVGESLSPQRFNVLLLGAFAGLALVLAAVGIYSVLAYSVRRRVREIGIRMALGATPANVLRMVLSDGMKPILLGVAIGLAAAAALGRVVSSLIYGVTATDPLTFAGVAFLLVLVGLFATALPALRATRVEPVRTLRED